MNARWILAGLIGGVVAGCGAEFSNAPFEQDARFVDAIPRAAELRLSAPVGQIGVRALAAEPAELYVFTRTTTLNINRSVFDQLREIDRLLGNPPSERTDDRRVWGPFRHPLDPHESRLVTKRVDDGFEWALGFRPKDSDDGFDEPIVGSFAPEGGPRSGHGRVTFDLDASRAFGGAGEGVVDVEYDKKDGELDLVLTFTGYRPNPSAARLDTQYAFRRGPDGSGAFEYAFFGDEDAVVEVRSRWQSDGAGRADARVSGLPDTPLTIIVSECWGSLFGRVFYTQTLEDGASLGQEDGDPDACVFGEVELPSRIEPPALRD